VVALAGHSSGAVVALEALAAEPGVFAGAVLYEPPVATGPPGPPAQPLAGRSSPGFQMISQRWPSGSWMYPE
jgi:alpha-beta hydrolase superfamily lysophospholipase